MRTEINDRFTASLLAACLIGCLLWLLIFWFVVTPVALWMAGV